MALGFLQYTVHFRNFSGWPPVRVKYTSANVISIGIKEDLVLNSRKSQNPQIEKNRQTAKIKLLRKIPNYLFGFINLFQIDSSSEVVKTLSLVSILYISSSIQAEVKPWTHQLCEMM